MKLTDKHFAKYGGYISKWQTYLGLTGWNITLQWDESDEAGDGAAGSALSYVRPTVKSHYAPIYLCRDWGKTPVTDEKLEETAFHEVCHVLLGDLVKVAEKNAPGSMYNPIQAMEHNVIRTLENLVFRILK